MSFDALMSLFFCAVPDDNEFYMIVAANIAKDHSKQLQSLLPALSSIRLRAAIFGLHSVDAEAVVSTLQPYLAHDDPMIVMETITALRHAQSPQWSLIEPFLRHRSEHVRGEALRFCGSRLGAKALPLLLKGLTDPHFIVVESAIDELDERNLMTDDAVAAVRPFLNHDYPAVRSAARWALHVTTIYKIISAPEWRAAEQAGVFRGAAIDLTDGYIHFSSAAQVEETAAKHFAGQSDLLLVSIDADKLGDALRWEVSRGGALFPHLYAPLAMDAVTRVSPLPLREDGGHDFEGLL